jgi:hypothetical protein
VSISIIPVPFILTYPITCSSTGNPESQIADDDGTETQSNTTRPGVSVQHACVVHHVLASPVKVWDKQLFHQLHQSLFNLSTSRSFSQNAKHNHLLRPPCHVCLYELSDSSKHRIQMPFIQHMWLGTHGTRCQALRSSSLASSLTKVQACRLLSWGTHSPIKQTAGRSAWSKKEAKNTAPAYSNAGTGSGPAQRASIASKKDVESTATMASVTAMELKPSLQSGALCRAC